LATLSQRGNNPPRHVLQLHLSDTSTVVRCKIQAVDPPGTQNERVACTAAVATVPRYFLFIHSCDAVLLGLHFSMHYKEQIIVGKDSQRITTLHTNNRCKVAERTIN
jgi:hypothetical protein